MPKRRDANADKTMEAETKAYVETLRRRGQLIEADRADAPLPPGVTHVLVKSKGKSAPRLVQRRKS